jgi:hypothetical protein
LRFDYLLSLFYSKGLNGILWGWGELIHEKNQKQKIS